MIIENINKVNDIKNIPESDLSLLADEIRSFLVEKVSKTGGHLASSLGVVELTIALHRVFDPSVDRIIWDVGHQSYAHKILTGRKEEFDNLRSFNGLSGFPKRSESICDAFDTGHSSTSISAGLGLARGRDLKGDNNYVISIIGDGSLTGGMSFEALNNASQLKSNFIIVLNDNNMSISANVGGLHKYLDNIRTADAYMGLKEDLTNKLSQLPNGEHIMTTLRKTKSGIKQLFVPGMLFEELGIKYLGPIDGHDINQISRTLNEAKKFKRPVLVHVRTIKGKGYDPAEKNPSGFHGIGPFDIETGNPFSTGKISYTEVFSRALCVIGKENKKVIAITAAMPEGTGLSRFAKAFPERYFDVGIAEQHAVTYAAGLALSGMIPVVSVYSSFLQRAFDQIVHDVCMQNLHVVFAVDRAGIVGKDGETHQGSFDLSYLSMIPGMTVMAPKNRWELIDMLQFAIDHDGPVAIRYPRGEAYEGFEYFRPPVKFGKGEFLYIESDIALIACGNMIKTADKVRKILKEKGFNCSLINARFIKPFDEELIRSLEPKHSLVVTMEENILTGGFGESVGHMIIEEKLDMDVLNISLPDKFIPQGNIEELFNDNNLDTESVILKIVSRFLGKSLKKYE